MKFPLANYDKTPNFPIIQELESCFAITEMLHYTQKAKSHDFPGVGGFIAI
jgi:hypothetical protein